MLKRFILSLLFLVITATSSANPSAMEIQGKEASANKLIEQTLNNFHQAAADANASRYFAQLTDNAIFLGTDASERWTKAEFKQFVTPLFNQGKGWTYTKVSRHISINKNHNSAFFDELLSNKNYGLCRGSGLLYKTKTGWKIAQYNLSIPLPNALAKNIVQQIKDSQQLKSRTK
jgi:ketosteroid isomerase-like protein